MPRPTCGLLYHKVMYFGRWEIDGHCRSSSHIEYRNCPSKRFLKSPQKRYIVLNLISEPYLQTSTEITLETPSYAIPAQAFLVIPLLFSPHHLYTIRLCGSQPSLAKCGNDEIRTENPSKTMSRGT